MKRLLFFVTFLISLESLASQFLFEENKGQWHDDVLFRTEIPGGYFYVTRTGMKYLYLDPDDAERYFGHHHHQNPDLRKAAIGGEYATMQAVEVNFIDISPDVRIDAKSPIKSYSNYFKGSDPKKWASRVQKYEEVMLKEIYPGIDLRYYSENGYLKYDFIIDAGADISQIRIEFNGASDLSLEEGELIVKNEFGKSVEKKPIAFQSGERRNSIVACEYQLNSNRVSFLLPKGYDQKRELIIDPALIFSTYSGSLADNWGFTATYDEEGNLYSGGIVRGIGFPTQNGVFQENFGGTNDIGILKFDSLGQELLFATYIGGLDSETPQSIIVDHNGDLVVYGTTSSLDFPVGNNAFHNRFQGGTPMIGLDTIPQPVTGVPFNNGSDLYLLKLSSDGTSLLASTYLGGSENDGIMLAGHSLTKNYGDQFRGEVIVDGDNNILIASSTNSTDFPIVNGFQTSYAGGSHDGVVVKMNSDLTDVIWSSYLGGADMDGIYSIKLDPDGNVIVAGGTISNDFPTTPKSYKPSNAIVGNIDGVVTKINSDGNAILASTYLGTGEYDQVFFVEVDSSRNIYVLGQTQGDYPVSDDVYKNSNSGQFIHKFSSDLDSTYFSTVFGSGTGSPNIRPTAFLVNECENILISGWGGETNSRNVGYVGGTTFQMPITDDAFQKTTDGSDFYLMVLLKDARQLLYATYFGGNSSMDHVDGGTSRFDNRGIVYQSVCASCGPLAVNDFPTTEGAWSQTDQSSNCNNAVFKFDVASLDARLATDSKEFDNPGITSGCWPLDIMFLNKSIGGVDFYWTFGNGEETDQKDSILVTYEDPGVYNVTLSATDINTCIRQDFDYGTITVFDQDFDIMDSTKICYGDDIRLSASGGVDYKWSPEEFMDNPNLQNPIATPDSTVYFKVFMTNDRGCEREDSVKITVVPEFTVDFSIQKLMSCIGTPDILFIDRSTMVDSLNWDFGDGFNSSADSLIYNYQKTDTFTVRLRGVLDICQKEKTATISSVETFVPNIITPNNDNKNDNFVVITDELVDVEIYNRWGDTVFEKVSYQGEFDGSGLAPGVYYYNVTFSGQEEKCNGWLQIMK